MRAELEEQFRTFAHSRAVPMRRFAYLLCGDWHLAEDLVQTCLIKLYRAWPRIQRREVVDGYVRRACCDAGSMSGAVGRGGSR